jgi:hypothetical protein
MRMAAWRLRLVTGSMAILAFIHVASALEGRVVDAATGEGIADATVTSAHHAIKSGSTGHFSIADGGDTIMARAVGYRAATLPFDRVLGTSQIALEAFRPRALYLSFYGIGYKPARDAALQLIRERDLNALTIDVKGDRGLIAYRTEVALARAVGADRITTIPDLPGLLRRLHAEGIYAIARIVVFKDEPLAEARPDLAVKTGKGGVFRDRERLAWTDPFRREVWGYNIVIAVEAARAGFDEIQFDYVRFPDAKDVRYSEPSTQSTRIAAITGFLTEARQALAPYNVFLAIDVFGYVCWNLDDTHIGQRIEDIVPLVDYVSPMLYPSGFQFGIPGYANPVQHPYEIVRLSLDRALARTHVSPLRFRPWLQAFKDYAFDRRVFDADEVKAQINAAESFGADGWMLWNPRNVYTGTGLSP